MTIIPKEEIDRRQRKLVAFSNAADQVVDCIFEIRKIPGHEGFKGSAIELGRLEECEQKDALDRALQACQLRAIDLGISFSDWQLYTLPELIAQREEQEEPEQLT